VSACWRCIGDFDFGVNWGESLSDAFSVEIYTCVTIGQFSFQTFDFVDGALTSFHNSKMCHPLCVYIHNRCRCQSII